MSRNQFPKGWDEKRVREVLAHYENQTQEEAVAEVEATYADPHSTIMLVPQELVPAIERLIVKHQAAQERESRNKSLKAKKPTTKKRVKS